MSENESILEKSNELAISEQEREIAAAALVEFNKNNYAACLQQLQKLDRSNDFKYLMNKAVVEYLKSDLKKTDQFKKALISIFNSSDLQLDILDDVEQCVAHFNYAVLLYHTKQYDAAIRVSEKIYKFIEPMDEYLAHKVCLLLLELYLCTQQPKKIANVFSFIESNLLSTEDAAKKTNDKNGKSSDKDAPDKKQQNSTASVDKFRKRLAFYKARYLLMDHSLKAAQVQIDSLPSSKQTALTIAFMKANLDYLVGNHKKALQTLQTSMNQVDTNEKDIAQVVLCNNLGVIHHAMGKPNLACHYLQRALKENQNLSIKSKPSNTEPLSNQPLHTLGVSRYHEIMHNIGITLLMAGKPVQAFEFLIVAVRRYHRNARLWLRLAECCIQVHKPTNETDFDLQKWQKSIIEKNVGTGAHRRVVIMANSSKNKNSSDTHSYAVPTPTLEFASICIRNAEALLPSEDELPPPPPPLLAPPPAEPDIPPGSAPSAPAGPRATEHLRACVLAAGAYIALRLGDWTVALERAKALLTAPGASAAHKLLAHLYSAEAYVFMNKLTEALEHLDYDDIKNIAVDVDPEDLAGDEIPLNTKPPTTWFPQNLGSAKAVLQYNMAAALALKGEYKKAEDTLKVIWQSRSNDSKIPMQMIMLVIYVDLQIGRTDKARTFIEKYSQTIKKIFQISS